MGIYGTGIFSNDIACDIRYEYNLLLSVKSDDDAERILISQYANILANEKDYETTCFWLALALCEWKKGRLSDFVKNKALEHISYEFNFIEFTSSLDEVYKKARRKTLVELREKLLSQMPSRSKVQKPRVSKCPWEEGSLLAYKICTNEDVNASPFFNKFILLRVIEIRKYYISKLLPELYDELMFVGMYNWIGASLPKPSEIQRLEYMAMGKEQPMLTEAQASFFDNPMFSGKIDKNSLVKPKIKKSICLEYRPKKICDKVITYIGKEDEFTLPDFFKDQSISLDFAGFYAFDIIATKALEEMQK